MKKINKPEGHSLIMPYIIVIGAFQFLEFLQNVFEAELIVNELRKEDQQIMHAEVRLYGEGTVMFAESFDEWKPQNSGLFIYVEDADTVYQRAVDAGATTIMPISDKDYGRTCGILDPFGNTWWITSVK